MIFLFEKGKDTGTLLKCIVGIKACKNGLRNMIWKKIWTVKYSFLSHLFPSLGLFDKAYIPAHFFAFLSFFFQTVSTTSVIIPALISNLFEALLLAVQHIKFDANLLRRRCESYIKWSTPFFKWRRNLQLHESMDRKIQSQEMKIVHFLNKSCKCLTSAHIRKLQKISATPWQKLTC